jgi:hypothetical protein
MLACHYYTYVLTRGKRTCHEGGKLGTEVRSKGELENSRKEEMYHHVCC